jgi:hypothetical protein
MQVVEILESIGTLGGAIIVAVITQVTPPVVKYIKSKTLRARKEEEFKKNLTIRSKINEALIEARVLSSANRSQLLEYHNGDISLNGLPFNYTSMTYESTDVSTKNLMSDFQKVPISPFVNFLLDLDKSKDNFLKLQNHHPDENINYQMGYYGVKTSYVFKISNNLKDGVVVLDWVEDKKVELTKEQIEDIKIIILKIKNLTALIPKH